MTADVFIRKLEAYVALPEADKCFLLEALADCRSYKARDNVLAEGDDPTAVHVVTSGLVCRSKETSNGGRQIAAFLLPGDFCDLHVFILREMDHAIHCVEDSTVCVISKHSVLEMLERPHLAHALLLSTLVDEAILREWVTNIGQRSAVQRMAHLFCELYLRMQVVGLANQNSYELPLTQADLADALGLSLVHTNKSLRVLRLEELVTHKLGQVQILDMQRLRERCGFKENYLHLNGGKSFSGAAGTNADAGVLWDARNIPDIRDSNSLRERI